jgi:predicted hydrocarbon binding protein
VKDQTIIEQNIMPEEPRTVSVFGYELLRDVLLPEILGKDAPEILYWAGKRIARKYPLKTFDEIIEFFSRASWGELILKTKTKEEIEFELISPLFVSRVKSKAEHFFQLEAGFLAQQIELQKEVVAETFEHPAKKSNKVQFTVKWDKKDSI